MYRHRSPPRLITLILLTAFSTMSLNMFLPSLANIAAEFDADYATVSLAVSGYLAITAIVHLIIGPLSDRIGRRPVLLVAIVVFTAASVICSLSTQIGTFLTFRLLQGGMVSGYALSLAIVRDTRSERNAASLLGYISMAMAVAPMLGPMLGGVLDTAFGWRANFYFYAACGFGLFWLCWVDLGETRPADEPASGPASGRTLDLIRIPEFWAYALCGAFSTGTFFIFITGAPLAAQAEFGVSTAELGFFIGTITAGFMLGGFLSGRYATRFGPTTLMLTGRLVACLGLSAGIGCLLSGLLSPVLFFGSTVFVGLGNGLTMPSCNASAMSVRPRLAGTAAGLNGALVVAAGAVLTRLTGVVLPDDGPALSLLVLMLSTALAGLLSVLAAMQLSRRRLA
ncbi:MAG: multidrug effflux MFS transporter [Pseudomonadota bacterium]